MRQLALLTGIFFGIAIVFYLSWLPQPDLGLYGFLPNWLARWTDADENMNLRTAVPFVGIGSLAGVLLGGRRFSWPFGLAVWITLTAVAFMAEIGQRLLPHRHFDWGDVAWGSVGSAIGLLASFGLRFLIHSVVKPKRSEQIGNEWDPPSKIG